MLGRGEPAFQDSPLLCISLASLSCRTHPCSLAVRVVQDVPAPHPHLWRSRMGGLYPTKLALLIHFCNWLTLAKRTLLELSSQFEFVVRESRTVYPKETFDDTVI